MAIDHIILITDSLGSVRQVVDPSVYPGQAHSLAICSILRSFFFQGYSYRIDFQNYFSKTKWSLDQLVHNNVTNTKMTTRFYLVTSINFLYSKSTISCLNIWRISFNYLTIQGQYFLSLRDRNCKSFQPSYFKGSSWLSHIGQSVTLCIRTTRAILNYTSIRNCTFSLQSAPSICMAITRQKHNNISFQTISGLPTIS